MKPSRRSLRLVLFDRKVSLSWSSPEPSCDTALPGERWRPHLRPERPSSWPLWDASSCCRGATAWALVIRLVVSYAIAARVEFEVGFASAVPTQLVFVPMLFLAPIGAVPLMVATAFVLSQLPEHLRGDWHPERIVLHLVSSWYAIGPVLVLTAAGTPAPGPGPAGDGPRPRGAVRVRPRRVGSASLPRAGNPVSLAAPGSRSGMAGGRRADARRHGARVHRHRRSVRVPPRATADGPARVLRPRAKYRIDQALELSHAYRGTALLLGDMVEADDAYTGLHSQDVVSLVLRVADGLGLDADDRRDAELTALLDDVGRVRIAKSIINKAGPLTDEERTIINTHTIEGQLMLEKVGGLLGRVGRLVRSCHERWDGQGYPDRLAGEDIPLVARIVCACDAFSAMTTDRPYRRALSDKEALAELRRCAGSQFDPDVVTR